MTTGRTSVGTGFLRWDGVGRPQPGTGVATGPGRFSPGLPAPKRDPGPRSDGRPSVPPAPPSRPWATSAAESVTTSPESTPLIFGPRRPRQALVSDPLENEVPGSRRPDLDYGGTRDRSPWVDEQRVQKVGPFENPPRVFPERRGRVLVDNSLENEESTCSGSRQPGAARAGRAAPAYSQDGGGDSAGGEVRSFRVSACVLAGCMALYLKLSRKVVALSRRALTTALPYLRAALPILLLAFVLGLGVAAGVQAGRCKPVCPPPGINAALLEEDAIASTGIFGPPERYIRPAGTQETPGMPEDARDDLTPTGEVRTAGFGWVTAADGALYHSPVSRGKAARGTQTYAEPSEPVGGPENDDWTARSPTASPQPPSGKGPTVEQLDFQWPVRGWISSPYGPRDGRMHYGIDIAAPFGAPVKAAAAGRVIFAGWYGSYGKTVIVRHRPDVVTLYAHLSSATAKAGQTVARGTELGRCGDTGHSKGPHLHFEIRINGRPVDPLPFLD